VAGFDPAASSSRRQSDTRMASAGTACTGGSLSTGVRQRPSKTGWVVTQFVTQTGGDHVRQLTLRSPALVLSGRAWAAITSLPGPSLRRERHRRSGRDPAMAAGEDDAFVPLRWCDCDRDRAAGALRLPRLMAGAGTPDRPRQVLAAAVAVRRSACPAGNFASVLQSRPQRASRPGCSSRPVCQKRPRGCPRCSCGWTTPAAT
jgi:hypothetical protein